MKNPDILTVFEDNFAIIGISVVLIVVEMDTQCYCMANTNSKRHYVSHGEETGQPLAINESCYCNTNQGNGLAPLSR